MTLPIEGVRKPVALVNKDGNEAALIFAGGIWRLAVDAVVVIGPVTPGATITNNADIVIGVGATVAFGAPPAGTSRMTVQNTGPAGTLIRVRAVGAGAGRGEILPRFGGRTYGDEGGAIAPLEAQEVAAIATSATITFEGP
jgi:hypothetical protein